MAITESLERTPTFEVSSTDGLIIPPAVLAKMGIQPGQKFVVMAMHGSIRLLPVISPQEARGSMPGLDTTVDREDDEERV